MHVALLANSGWLDDELLNFQHLVVGLIDEQVRVTQVVPPVLGADDTSAFAELLVWRESRWPAWNRLRLHRLDRALTGLHVDLIHVMDAALWPGAAAVSRSLGIPAVYNVNTPDDLRSLPRLLRATAPARTAWVATSAPVGRALAAELEPSHKLETIPPGVHPGEPVRQRAADDALCAVISGDGQSDAYYDALMRALVEFTRRCPQAQFFLDGRGSDQHALWQMASRRGLLSNLSLVPRRLGHHELLVRADVLIHPQPSHRARSLTLQAMANAVPVIAMDDGWVDHLIDGETAWIVPQAHSHAWLERLSWLVGQPEAAEALGQRALSWVREHRLASQQVGATLDLYRGMTGETLKFPAKEAG